MIDSYAEYKRTLFLYVSALHAWGFRESNAVDVTDYHGVALEMFDRTIFLVDTYSELLAWTKTRKPWLVVDNPEVRITPPRGIAAPVKPLDLIELEKDIEEIFGVDLQGTASTAWHDSNISVEKPGTWEWLESARNRLAEHIADTSRRLDELTGEKEVLVLPHKIDAYIDTDVN